MNRDDYYVYAKEGYQVFVDDGFDYFGNEIKEEDDEEGEV